MLLYVLDTALVFIDKILQYKTNDVSCPAVSSAYPYNSWIPAKVKTNIAPIEGNAVLVDICIA